MHFLLVPMVRLKVVCSKYWNQTNLISQTTLLCLSFVTNLKVLLLYADVDSFRPLIKWRQHQSGAVNRVSFSEQMGTWLTVSGNYIDLTFQQLGFVCAKSTDFSFGPGRTKN